MVASNNQASQAYGELRRRILIAEIRPDERLVERTWATRLNLGRLAVREALTRLHGEGLVMRALKGGFFAAPMNDDDVHETREVREILEVAAVRLAAGRITAEQISQLDAACDDFAFLVKKKYFSGAWEADRRFHELLVAASGNKKLLHDYERCNIPLFQVRESQEYREDYERTEADHRAIVTALKEADFEKAVERLRAHLAWGESAVIASLPNEAARRI